MHSVFSDGKGTINEITQAAAAVNLDFVILTDHGRPNIKSSISTSWLNNVLLIGGTELSLNSGHLAALGFQVPDYIFPPEPQEAIDEIIGKNGICFLSHPFDDKVPWTDWDISGFTGIEVLSSYTEARRAGLLNLLVFPLKYHINSKYSLLNSIGYPANNIKKWDSLNESGRYYSIYALDAHAKLTISKNLQLHFPTYQSMFEILTVYVKISQTPQTPDTNPHQAADMIISSLRNGNFFNVIEGIAPANGFDAYFIEKNSRKRIEIGGLSTEKQGKLVILLPFDFESNIFLLRNGITNKQMTNNRLKQLEIDINEPGVYRIEVYVPGNTFHKLPWIITNPFFIGVEREDSLPQLSSLNDEIKIKQTLLHGEDAFQVEKNSSSLGVMDYQSTSENEKIMHFKFILKKNSQNDENFWSALALRKRFDFSDYNGFVFEGKTDKKRRFWVEFRTGEGVSEIWYRHSFLVGKEWKKFHFPFKKFHVIHGKKKTAELSRVRSIFFSINNANAYPGTEGEIFFKNVGIY